MSVYINTCVGYDTRGNLTSSGSTAYGYTVENRLKSVSGAMTASYDTLGRLAEYNTSVSTRFLYDGDRVTAELENQGAINPVKRRYVWGAGEDELVAWYEGAGNATRRFVVQDERASIVAVSDSAGTLVGINRYDEYGIPAATNIGRFQYTGQAFLVEAGLHHYKARAYSPTLGRFLQTDPIGYGDGINWYDYVDGDPVNRSDPTGLQSVQDQQLQAQVADMRQQGMSEKQILREIGRQASIESAALATVASLAVPLEGFILRGAANLAGRFGSSSFAAAASSLSKLGSLERTGGSSGRRTLQGFAEGGQGAARKIFDGLTGGKSVARDGGRLGSLGDGSRVQTSTRTLSDGTIRTNVRIQQTFTPTGSNVPRTENIKIRFDEKPK